MGEETGEVMGGWGGVGARLCKALMNPVRNLAFLQSKMGSH